MSRTMRALRVTKPGSAEIVEAPVPAPGPGQVLLRVAGAGLCHSDLLVINADPPFFPLPLTLGHETTGWIEAVGAGVSGLKQGDAYAVYFPWGCGHCARCAHGHENICERPGFGPGAGTDGGMAEYVLIDHPRHLIPLGNLDPVEAAPLMCAGLTSYHAIQTASSALVPGSTAVLIGIGGLGHLAIQILRALAPVTIVAIDAHEDKLAHARELGAHHALLFGADTAARIRELSNGLGAMLAIDMVGKDTTMALGLASLGFGGQLKVVGVGGGTLPLTFYAMPRDSSVTMPYAGTLADCYDVVRLAQEGLIKPQVERITFEDVVDAYTRMDRGKLRGRAVLVP
jgi:alcohol dehydrogenase, propanol-preferring